MAERGVIDLRSGIKRANNWGALSVTAGCKVPTSQVLVITWSEYGGFLGYGSPRETWPPCLCTLPLDWDCQSPPLGYARTFGSPSGRNSFRRGNDLWTHHIVVSPQRSVGASAWMAIEGGGYRKVVHRWASAGAVTRLVDQPTNQAQ